MIRIHNLTAALAQEDFLKKVTKTVLKREKKKKTELSIILVGPGKIKELSKKYRRKNRATDVLSFFYDSSGEIVICPREVKKNAKIFKSTYKKELARVLVHGILHLLGYDHEKNESGAKEMHKKEENYLEKIFK